MTKTQISVRVSPDTLAAIDAQAERLGISRGALIDRWLGQQAAAGDPAKRRSIEEVLLAAAEAAAKANYGATDTQILVALDRIVSAMRLMAGID